MSGIDDFQALLGVPVTPVQRRRQQASQARIDQAAFDDFEQHHPPSAALNYLLYEVVCDLVPDDADAGFGDTWVDHVVSHADQDLPAGPGRWVRLAVGLAAEEYQLGNAELEAIERV